MALKSKKTLPGIRSDQIELIILIVMVCLVVAGLIALWVRDANRKSYLDEVHQKNLNAPVEVFRATTKE